MIYAIISTLIITILLSWLLSKFHVKRIQTLRDATGKVASGDYDISLKNSGGDEIGMLASDFNIMAKNLKQSREQIDRLEKRRRQFIADVSHELRTPLTTINGLVEGLNSNTIPEKDKEKCFSLISEETKRMLRLVKENLDYEKSDPSKSNWTSSVCRSSRCLKLLKSISISRRRKNKISRGFKWRMASKYSPIMTG